MSLDDLIELWTLLMKHSAGGVAVNREVAEKTLVALMRLVELRDAARREL